jgi:hypothetical protein
MNFLNIFTLIDVYGIFIIGRLWKCVAYTSVSFNMVKNAA